MEEIYLDHFCIIIMHSVEDKDHKSPIAIHGPAIIDQMKIECPNAGGFKVTRLGWRSHFYSDWFFQSVLEESFQNLLFSECLSAQFTSFLGTFSAGNPQACRASWRLMWL